MIAAAGYGERIKQAVLDWSAREGVRQTLDDVGRVIAKVIGRPKPFTASTVNGWTKEESEPTLSVFLALAHLSGRGAAWIAFGDDRGGQQANLDLLKPRPDPDGEGGNGVEGVQHTPKKPNRPVRGSGGGKHDRAVQKKPPR